MAGRVAVGEVTQEFADGGHYVKSKLESVARDILNTQFAADEARKKAEAEASAPSEQVAETDVSYLMAEFELARTDAEQALRLQSGNLERAARALVGLPLPPLPAPSAPAAAVDGSA